MSVPHVRAMTDDDVPAWARLLAEAEAVEPTGRHPTEADLAEERANPDTEDADFLCAVDGDRLVAVAAVLPRGETEGAYKVQLDGTVAPDRRGEGLGTDLARRGLARSRELRARHRPDLPLRVSAGTRVGSTAQESLLADLGMRPDRWSFVMRTSLDRLRPAPPVPAGYLLQEYDGRSEDLREAHNAAFLGHHPGFTPWTRPVWEQWVTGSATFRPDLTRLLVPEGSDRIAAYVVTVEFDGYRLATGRREAHVSRVGTLAGHRGRGLAGALLGDCLARSAAAGYDEASLHVDAANPTGALGVYERAGFEVEARWAGYVLDEA